MPSVPVEEIRLIVLVGLMLLFGLFAGEMVARVRIPRVTGYVLAGVILSPSVTGLIGISEVRNFDLIAQLALGLIMFNIGGRFKARHVRRFVPRLLAVTALEMGLTWTLVGGAIWFFSRDAVLALVVGFIAMETAPAATLVVVKEYDSEGPLTSNLIALVGINNFFCLVFFSLLLVALKSSGGISGVPLLEVGKSVLLGAGLGLGLSFMEERSTTPQQQIVLGFCAIALVVGLAYAWGGSGPLSALVMGATKVNSSSRGAALFERIDSGAYPLYVLFFVTAGANLHLETLSHAGVLGLIYILGRASGKILGAACGAHIAGLSGELKKYLGPAMISHAGVAIGLAMAVGQLDSPSAPVAQAIVLGSVVIYEMIGPIAVRFSLVRCGEVKMASLLPKLGGQSGADTIDKIAGQIRRSLGLRVKSTRRGDQPLTAKHLMRTNVETVPESTRFDELLRMISHARYDLLPVVDKDGNYVGNISLSRIRDVIFDQALADLLIARDLLDFESAYVTPEEELEIILQKFHNIEHEVGHLPVVVTEGGITRVVGMVRQLDVVDIFRRFRMEEEKTNRTN